MSTPLEWKVGELGCVRGYGDRPPMVAETATGKWYVDHFDNTDDGRWLVFFYPAKQNAGDRYEPVIRGFFDSEQHAIEAVEQFERHWDVVIPTEWIRGPQAMGAAYDKAWRMDSQRRLKDFDLDELRVLGDLGEGGANAGDLRGETGAPPAHPKT